MKIKQSIKISGLAITTITAIILSGCTSVKKAPIEGIGPASGTPFVETSGLGYTPGLQGESISQLQKRIDNFDSYTYEQQQEMISALSNISCKVVHFSFNSIRLTDDAQKCLKQIADYLIKHNKQPIRLAGHTDPRGSEKYNLNLGQRRGESVQKYLLQQGVSSNQICIVSYGKSQPVISPQALYAQVCSEGENEQCKIKAQEQAYYLDRRVELDFGQKCG